MNELGDSLFREMERLTERVNRIDLSSSQSSSYIEVNRTRLNKIEGLV